MWPLTAAKSTSVPCVYVCECVCVCKNQAEAAVSVSSLPLSQNPLGPPEERMDPLWILVWSVRADFLPQFIGSVPSRSLPSSKGCPESAVPSQGVTLRGAVGLA